MGVHVCAAALPHPHAGGTRPEHHGQEQLGDLRTDASWGFPADARLDVTTAGAIT